MKKYYNYTDEQIKKIKEGDLHAAYDFILQNEKEITAVAKHYLKSQKRNGNIYTLDDLMDSLLLDLRFFDFHKGDIEIRHNLIISFSWSPWGGLIGLYERGNTKPLRGLSIDNVRCYYGEQAHACDIGLTIEGCNEKNAQKNHIDKEHEGILSNALTKENNGRYLNLCERQIEQMKTLFVDCGLSKSEIEAISFDLDYYSYEDAAFFLGKSQGGYKSALCQARKKLKENKEKVIDYLTKKGKGAIIDFVGGDYTKCK